MDEEDGKTGARARQSGQLNAAHGVPAQSLCPPQSKTSKAKNLGAPGPSLLGTWESTVVYPGNSIEFFISKESIP